MIVLCLHLEQLSRAGVPIHEALADVRDSTDSNKLRDVVTDVLEKVKSGSSLSEAFATYPRVFNEVFVGLVAAGEKTGKLTDSFTAIADNMKWNSEMRRKVKKAVTYPIVLVVVMSAVIAILMTAVVPKPIRVKNIFICSRVVFWLSSKITNELFSVRPRINASGATSIMPRSINFPTVSKPNISKSASYSGRK